MYSIIKTIICNLTFSRDAVNEIADLLLPKSHIILIMQILIFLNINMLKILLNMYKFYYFSLGTLGSILTVMY